MASEQRREDKKISTEGWRHARLLPTQSLNQMPLRWRSVRHILESHNCSFANLLLSKGKTLGAVINSLRMHPWDLEPVWGGPESLRTAAATATQIPLNTSFHAGISKSGQLKIAVPWKKKEAFNLIISGFKLH